jgi:hypothetical protein
MAPTPQRWLCTIANLAAHVRSDAASRTPQKKPKTKKSRRACRRVPRATAAPRLEENGAVQYLRHMSPLKHLKDSSVAHANCGERMAYGLTPTTTTKRFFS